MAEQRTGIIAGVLLFAVVSLIGYTYRTAEQGADGFVYQGLPLAFHTSGGIAGVNVFDPAMLALDALVWAGIAFLGVIASRRVRR